jgi:hypothetical protein
VSEHQYTLAERLDQLDRFERGCTGIAALLARHGRSPEPLEALASEAQRLRREGFRPEELSDLARSVPRAGRHPRELDDRGGESWELELAALDRRVGDVVAQLRARAEWR